MQELPWTSKKGSYEVTIPGVSVCTHEPVVVGTGELDEMIKVPYSETLLRQICDQTKDVIVYMRYSHPEQTKQVTKHRSRILS